MIPSRETDTTTTATVQCTVLHVELAKTEYFKTFWISKIYTTTLHESKALEIGEDHTAVIRVYMNLKHGRLVKIIQLLYTNLKHLRLVKIILLLHTNIKHLRLVKIIRLLYTNLKNVRLVKIILLVYMSLKHIR